MSTNSKHEFIANVQKSGVVDSEEFQEWLKVVDANSAKDLAAKMVRDQLLTAWQAKYLLSGLTRLDIGSYRLLERIARNELGDRFLAFHVSLHRKVDLLLLPAALTTDQERCHKFIEKVGSVTKLDHPNLVHVYDIDKEQGRYYLVTEHVEGISLDQAARTELDEQDIAAITQQAFVGITNAHQGGVVHGNITESDIVITKNEIKIQNLPLHPLRNPNSDTESPIATFDVAPVDDFSAIASIGINLLHEIPSSKRTSGHTSLSQILKQLDPTNPATMESVSRSLTDWIELKDQQSNNGDSAEDENSATRDQVSGGDHQANPSDSRPGIVVQSDQQSPLSDPDAMDGEPRQPAPDAAKADQSDRVGAWGFLIRWWRKNPVALMAVSAMVAFLVGGIGWATWSMSDSESNNVAGLSDDRRAESTAPNNKRSVPSINRPDNGDSRTSKKRGNTNRSAAPEQATRQPDASVGKNQQETSGKFPNKDRIKQPIAGQPEKSSVDPVRPKVASENGNPAAASNADRSTANSTQANTETHPQTIPPSSSPQVARGDSTSQTNSLENPTPADNPTRADNRALTQRRTLQSSQSTPRSSNSTHRDLATSATQPKVSTDPTPSQSPGGDSPELAGLESNRPATVIEPTPPATNASDNLSGTRVEQGSPTIPEPPDMLMGRDGGISGIGPATQKILFANRITTFRQLAALSQEEFDEIFKGASWVGKSDHADWVGQAKARIGSSGGTESSSAMTSAGDPVAPGVSARRSGSPFASFPRTTSLPAVTDTKEIKIADLLIDPGYLLGAEMVSPESISKAPMIFELNRAPDDQQKWIVGFKRRANSEPVPIASFRKSENAFLFQWLPEAANNRYTEFLRNCFVKLILPDEQATYLTLREPIKVADLRLTEREMVNRLQVEIPGVPDLNSIVVEVLPLDIKGVDTTVVKSGVEPNSPAIIWLKETDKTGFLSLQISMEMTRSKLELQSNLVLVDTHNRPHAVTRLEMLSELEANVAQREIDAYRILEQAKFAAENAPYGKKTEYRKIASEREDDLKDAIQLKQKVHQYKQILPTILNQPVSIRVFAKHGNLQTQIIETDPELFIEK